MGKIFQQQIRVVSRDKIRSSTTVMEAAFFDEDGNALELGGASTPATNVAVISVADATDEASAITLVNATKAKVNELISALTAAGFIAEA